MDAKWLFQNRRTNLGELCLLERELKELEPTQRRSTAAPLNAIHLHDDSSPIPQIDIGCVTFNIQRDSLARYTKLRAQYLRCKHYEALYESTLLTLSDVEKWIVETHFIAGRTITETLTLVPEDMLITSRSCLVRRINKLLRKADAFLSNHLNDDKEGNKSICYQQSQLFSTASPQPTIRP